VLQGLYPLFLVTYSIRPHTEARNLRIELQDRLALFTGVEVALYELRTCERQKQGGRIPSPKAMSPESKSLSNSAARCRLLASSVLLASLVDRCRLGHLRR
jgi:hypothetical protein